MNYAMDQYTLCIAVALWIYQERRMRQEYGWHLRTIIDAKGWEETLHWPDAQVTEMVLPGMN